MLEIVKGVASINEPTDDYHPQLYKDRNDGIICVKSCCDIRQDLLDWDIYFSRNLIYLLIIDLEMVNDW